MHNDTWLKGGKDYIYVIKDFVDKATEFKTTAKDNAMKVNQGGTAVQRRQVTTAQNNQEFS